MSRNLRKKIILITAAFSAPSAEAGWCGTLKSMGTLYGSVMAESGKAQLTVKEVGFLIEWCRLSCQYGKQFTSRKGRAEMARNITVIPAKSRNELQGKSRTEKKLKVAAYCRVSTDQEDQLHSFEAQVEYYTRYISDHPNYEMAGIYADEGITGTNTKKREQFRRMISDCE